MLIKNGEERESFGIFKVPGPEALQRESTMV
jgi:hypothetical protein